MTDILELSLIIKRLCLTAVATTLDFIDMLFDKLITGIIVLVQCSRSSRTSKARDSNNALLLQTLAATAGDRKRPKRYDSRNDEH
jgi:hypothetical protein